MRSLLALSTVAAPVLAGSEPDKHAAVNKVIDMLENLRDHCVDEGRKEAKSYDTFACYCKESTKEKADAIQTGEDERDRLSAKSKDLSEKRDDLDKDIEDLEDDIADIEKDMKEAKEERAKERKLYEKNEADLAGAVYALEGAIESVKDGQPSLLQISSLREVALMSDAMGFGGAKAQNVLASLIRQEAKVPSETYESHSEDIIDMLEELETDFKAQKKEVDDEEEEAVKEHRSFMKNKKKNLEIKTNDLEDKKEERGETVKKIGDTSEELTATVAVLYDDQEYMTEVSKMCSEKAQTWDQRVKVRTDELSALSAAIDIMKDRVKEQTSDKTVRFIQAANVELAAVRARNPGAMNNFEAEAEQVEGKSFLQLQATPRAVFASIKAKQTARQLRQATSELQKPSTKKDILERGREAVVDMLATKGRSLKSTLLTELAVTLSKDPLAKVKKLIQELIERLLHEAAEEGNQKGFCDKAMSDAKQKRDYAAEEIASLNAEMSELEARRDQLTTDLDTLEKEIAELDEKQEEATKLRKEEKAENEATVEEADLGLEAVKEAIDILEKFYKTAEKEKVELELVQRGPMDDAPDAGFDGGEAYTGAQGAGGGVLGMMDVIKSDFERTIKVTEKAEEDNQKEYDEFMTESGKSLAEKKMAEKQKKKQKTNTVDDLEAAQENLDEQSEKLDTSIEELLELKPTCQDTGMSYEERVAAREEELEALKKALCIFENFHDGMDAAGDC